MWARTPWIGCVFLVTLLVAPAGAAVAVVPPPTGGRFEYQIGGAHELLPETRIVSRDRLDPPAEGVYSICYVNSFQTQPGELRWWRRHHPGLLLRRAGRLVVDRQWGEVLFDTSTRAKRTRLTRVQSAWIADCAVRGYRAVEFDNLDSYLRSRGRLKMRHNLDLGRRLTSVSHRLGLAAAQKNAAELGELGRTRAGFDFAVVEECRRYRECDRFSRVWGEGWIEVEYSDGDPQWFARACSERGMTGTVLLRDRNVVPRGHPDFVSRWC